MRSVVITGVSRGLGAALFERLAHGGDRVMAIGRHFSDAQRGLAAAEPDRIRLCHADLRDPAALPGTDALRDFLRAEVVLTGGLSEAVLIHNAGVVQPIGAVGTLDPPEVAATVAVNLTAPMVLTNAFLAARPAGAPARILYISSGAAHRAVDGWAVYSATKRGGEAFFDAVANEQPEVAVVNVNPGVMDTAMQATLRGADFPERDRFVDLHERGELPDPGAVARRIIDEYLNARITGR